MRGHSLLRYTRPAAAALVGTALLAMPVVAETVLQPDTKGCNGVLPSGDGNTNMTLVGGTLTPGGTAVFEISYPLDPDDVGKNFSITACAYINDVAALKYLVTFVPSNQFFTLRFTFAVPRDAPVGGRYCNYTKTTRSPTSPQASQRKAGPTCFIIRPPATTSNPPPRGGTNPPAPNSPSSPGGDPPSLPDTAMAAP